MTQRTKPRIGTCAECGNEFEHWAPRGRVPGTCPQHRPSHNKARQARAAERAGATEAARALGKTSATDRSPALQSALMAIGLSLHRDPKVAADLVGLPYDAKLVKRAKKEWPELVQGSSLTLMKMLDGSLKLQALNAVADAQQVTASNRASALQSLSKALGQLHEVNSQVFTENVKVVWSEEAAA